MNKILTQEQLVKIGLIVAILFSVAKDSFFSVSPDKKPLRISAWYWLNSAEREEWASDFRSAAEAGFTDLLLCWGLDGAAPRLQKENTRLALDLCARNGMRAYLFVWHPSHNSLPRRPEFQQFDNRGNRLFSFNLFHREWRATQWKAYLQEVAHTYKDHPAFAGYLFDDTFGLGNVESISGTPGKKRGDFVSYSAYDLAQFREWLQNKYPSLSSVNNAWQTDLQDWKEVEPPREITTGNEPVWEDWCQARLSWLEDWAVDTVRFIRQIDPSPDHEIYLEDAYYVLGLEPRAAQGSVRPVTVTDTIGLDFGRVARHFDAVCGYTYFRWGAPDSLEKALLATRQILNATRDKVGEKKKIIYTFWVADVDINKPLPVDYPDAAQITSISRSALDLGIRHIDYYGFRIGDWRVTDAEWQKLRPGSNLKYPVLRKISGRFLCDRPQVLKALAEQHRQLKSQYN